MRVMRFLCVSTTIWLNFAQDPGENTHTYLIVVCFNHGPSRWGCLHPIHARASGQAELVGIMQSIIFASYGEMTSSTFDHYNGKLVHCQLQGVLSLG